jgi:hypothetical protein
LSTKSKSIQPNRLIIESNNFIVYFPQDVAKIPNEIYGQRRVVISVTELHGEIGVY